MPQRVDISTAYCVMFYGPCMWN